MAELSQATKQAVAKAVADGKLFRYGEFVLKSGITAPYYFDLRKAQSTPATFRTIVDAYSELVSDMNPDAHIAGIPEAATPTAGALGYSIERPLIQPRKVVKEYGTKSSVEGYFDEGDHVIAIDDLITKGDSKLEAIQQLEGAGLVVEKFVVLIDMEKGGMNTIRDAGYDIQAGMTISELVELLHEIDSISDEEHRVVTDFIRNN